MQSECVCRVFLVVLLLNLLLLLQVRDDGDLPVLIVLLHRFVQDGNLVAFHDSNKIEKKRGTKIQN